MSCCKQCPIHSDSFTRTSLETLDFLSQTATSDGWTVTMASTPTAAQAGDTISGLNVADERFYYYVAAVSGDDVDIEYLYGPSGYEPEERSPEDQDIMEFDVKRLASSYATPDAAGKPANYLWGITADGLVSNSDYRLEIVPMAGKSNFIADFTWENDTTNKEFVLWTEAGQNTSSKDAGNKVVFWDAGCSTCDDSRNERYRMFIAGSYPSATANSTYSPEPLSGSAVTTASSATTYEITVAPGENNAIPGWTWAFQEDGADGETASIFYYRVVSGGAEDGGGYTSPLTGGNGVVLLEYLYDTENVGARNPYGIADDVGDQATATIYPWLEYAWNTPELAGTVRGKLRDASDLVQLQVCQKLWSRAAASNQVTIFASSGTNPELPIAMTAASAFASTNTFSSIGGSDTGLDDKVMLSATKGKLIKSLKFEYNNNESGQGDCRPCMSLTCQEESTDLMFSDTSSRDTWDADVSYSPGERYGDQQAAGFVGTVNRSAKTLTLAGPAGYTPDTTSGQTFDLFGELVVGQHPSANLYDANGQTHAGSASPQLTMDETRQGYGTYRILELTMERLFTLEVPDASLTIICGDTDGTGGSINGEAYAKYPVKSGKLYRVTICETPINTEDSSGNNIVAWKTEWRLQNLSDDWEYGK